MCQNFYRKSFRHRQRDFFFFFCIKLDRNVLCILLDDFFFLFLHVKILILPLTSMFSISNFMTMPVYIYFPFARACDVKYSPILLHLCIDEQSNELPIIIVIVFIEIPAIYLSFIDKL